MFSRCEVVSFMNRKPRRVTDNVIDEWWVTVRRNQDYDKRLWCSVDGDMGEDTSDSAKLIA